MTFSLAHVDAAMASVRAVEGVDLTSLPRAELVALMRDVGAVKGACDRLAAEVAGEAARRSAPEDGANGLARKQGFATPGQLVASVMDAAPGDGFKLVTAGTAMRQDRPLAGGLKSGLSVAKAELIASTLGRLEGDTRELEARLVAAAKRLDYRRLKLACAREATLFDATHKEGLEKRQHEQRSLEIKQETSGAVTFTGTLGPVQGAILITYLDAQVKAAFQARHDDESAADDRTPSQVRADALIALAAHGLDCTSKATGVKATIILRVNADDSDKDIGIATCDALSTPISLTALRELAMDATIMPMLVNSKSQCLDLGYEQRLFTWAQRMALAERDGGCAKCHAPISHCIAHHIRWWHRDKGPTDLSNGVLLCVRCHTQIHRDHWDITVDENNHVWFTPPRDVDPERRRILGGLAALTV